LGQQVGLSASYLSQVERGVTTPSLSRLTAIAEALDVGVRFFFEDEASSPRVIRSDQGRKLNNSATNTILELLSADLPGQEIQPYRVICNPGASTDQLPTHPGEELFFVVKGQLTVTVGEERFVLEAGDSLHYQAIQPHSLRNEGDKECIAILAISPPIPDDNLGG